jgi:transcriptional regulator with XRE-family HTH domain
MTEMMAQAPFSEVLKAFRKRSGLTQQQLAAAIGMHRNAISRWEQGDFLPENKEIVQALAEALRLDSVEARHLLTASLTVQAPLNNVPYQRNPLFTGREEWLQTLHQYLIEEPMVALTQVYAVHGLGGIGKTQLAVEYTHRYGSEYTAVLWVQAETIENIQASMLSIAELLQLAMGQESMLQRVLVAVQRWLSTHSRWLLIWDNLEELELLGRYLPAGHQGKVLITTRQQALGSLAQGLELPVMGLEEGEPLLLKRAKLVGPRASREELQRWQQRAPQEEKAARELVAAMEGLPLALDQAGAYIEETGCSLSEYLRLYQQQGLRLLARRGMQAGDHPHATVATFQQAYQWVQKRDLAAADLLCLCAFLSSGEIPEELLETGAEVLDTPLQDVMKDLYQFNLALATLRSQSLVRRTPETRALSVHRLVQEVLREQMEPAACRMWGLRVVRIVNAAFPVATGQETEHQPECQRYQAHVEACLHFVEQWNISCPEAASLFHRAGMYLRKRNQYKLAEKLLMRAYAIEAQLSTEQPLLSTPSSMLTQLSAQLPESEESLFSE